MKNQFGRSMVEMLGVLGVIGLLSIAGIEGYQYAVLRHRSNVVLKMAHQIAADILNLPGMYQQTAAWAELRFTDRAGMTFPFAEGNMTATKIDGTVFRVNTPPLSEEQCQAVLKYARNYPLILEKTFALKEDGTLDNCAGGTGLLYFSLDYGADDLNSTPETPPPDIPSCGLCETFNKDTNQCECTTGTCTTSDGQKGVCSNCACIIENTPSCGLCETFNEDTNQCECTPGTCETSDGQKGVCSNCACIPDNSVKPACEPACSDGYCCIRTLLEELLCLEDGSTNGQPCKGINDTSCPTNYACRELNGAFKCVLDCDSTSTGGGVAGGSVAGGGVTGGGAAGGVVSCSPDKDKEKTLKLYGKEWTVKSNYKCEKSPDNPDNKYECAICPLAGYCSRYSMSTSDGCGCPDNVYYGIGKARKCCVDEKGNVGQVPDNYHYEYCYPSKAVSGFWCQDRVGSFPGFCCPDGAREKKLGETPISDTIQSPNGNLYYSLEYCVCPENTVFNPDANNGYGACVECIEEGQISDGKGHCCNPNDHYYISGCLCTPDYLKYKCDNDEIYCGWEKELKDGRLVLDGGIVSFPDSYHRGTCITCDGDGTWCGGPPSGCCPCYNLKYEDGSDVNPNGECNYCREEYISGYTEDELKASIGERKDEVKVYSYPPYFTDGICLECAKYGGVWVPGSEYTKNSYCVFCPEDRPKWNGDEKRCEECPYGAPVWDGKKCVTCYQYDAEKPYWDGDSCESCPDGAPAWNGNDSCMTCYDLHGDGSPYWNGNECVACADDPNSGGVVWDNGYGACVPCPYGAPKWDGYNCVTCSQHDPGKPLWNGNDECVSCPDGAPVWHDYNGCVTCYQYDPGSPYWNGSYCEPCPACTVYDDNSGKCIAVPTGCPDGY